MSEEEQVAVTRLAGSIGATTDAEWLQRMAMETPYMEVAHGAMKALEHMGGLDNARWLLARLDTPPPSIRAAKSCRKDWEKLQDELQEAARNRGDEDWYRVKPDGAEPARVNDAWEEDVHRAVVKLGNDDLGMELAWKLDGHRHGIELCRQYGRLPSHALLVLGAIANDPGEHVVPASITGGGDEVAGSGTPDEVRAAIRAIVKRTDAEAVRRHLLEAMLRGYGPDWGSGESWGLLERIFFQAGGPLPGDQPRLLVQLEASPMDEVALRYLAIIGTGEGELLDILRRQGVHWLPRE